MKKELKVPTKIKVDFSIFKDKNFLEDFGEHLKETLGAVNQIDVSKIWVNPITYDKFQEKILKQLSLKEGKQKAKRVVGWVCLQYAPACDYENRFGLEDDFIYVEQDFEVAPRN